MRVLFAVLAAASAVVLAGCVVQWAGWAPRSAGVGLGRAVEADRHRLAADETTVQIGRGGLWVGRCRVTILAPLGLPDPGSNAAEFESLNRRVDVFSIEKLEPPLAGLGRQRAAVTEPAGAVLLGYEVDGFLVPHAALAPAAAALPAVWLARRFRRSG